MGSGNLDTDMSLRLRTIASASKAANITDEKIWRPEAPLANRSSVVHTSSVLPNATVSLYSLARRQDGEPEILEASPMQLLFP